MVEFQGKHQKVCISSKNGDFDCDGIEHRNFSVDPKFCASTRRFIQGKLYSKYSRSNYNYLVVDSLIKERRTKKYLLLQENLIDSPFIEFFKREYKPREVAYKINKLNEYYQNYSKFFLIPFLMEFVFNTMIQKTADMKADLFYKLNKSKTDRPHKEQENGQYYLLNQEVVAFIEASIYSSESIKSEPLSEDICDFRAKPRIFFNKRKKKFTNSFYFSLNEENQSPSSNLSKISLEKGVLDSSDLSVYRNIRIASSKLRITSNGTLRTELELASIDSKSSKSNKHSHYIGHQLDKEKEVSEPNESMSKLGFKKQKCVLSKPLKKIEKSIKNRSSRNPVIHNLKNETHKIDFKHPPIINNYNIQINATFNNNNNFITLAAPTPKSIVSRLGFAKKIDLFAQPTSSKMRDQSQEHYSKVFSKKKEVVRRHPEKIEEKTRNILKNQLINFLQMPTNTSIEKDDNTLKNTIISNVNKSLRAGKINDCQIKKVDLNIEYLKTLKISQVCPNKINGRNSKSIVDQQSYPKSKILIHNNSKPVKLRYSNQAVDSFGSVTDLLKCTNAHKSISKTIKIESGKHEINEDTKRLAKQFYNKMNKNCDKSKREINNSNAAASSSNSRPINQNNIQNTKSSAVANQENNKFQIGHGKSISPILIQGSTSNMKSYSGKKSTISPVLKNSLSLNKLTLASFYTKNSMMDSNTISNFAKKEDSKNPSIIERNEPYDIKHNPVTLFYSSIKEDTFKCSNAPLQAKDQKTLAKALPIKYQSQQKPLKSGSFKAAHETIKKCETTNYFLTTISSGHHNPAINKRNVKEVKKSNFIK